MSSASQVDSQSAATASSITNTKPRVLVVATVAPMVRSFLLPFASHFRALGWQVDAVAAGITACPECTAHFDRVWNISWSRGPLRPANWFGPPRFLRQLVTQQQYDLVHVHSPVAAFVTRYALRQLQRRGKPLVVYTAHGFHFHRHGHPLKNRVFAQAEKIAGRWTDELIVMNREDLDAAHRLQLVPPEHVTYMPGIGVDVSQYDAQRVTAEHITALRAELGLGPTPPIFVMIAEFIARKRHRDVLEALRRLERPDVHLLLAGDGPLRAEMERLAEQWGLGQRVHFLGLRRDVPVLLRSAVASLLPSVQEGLPRAVMESMCLETPVIGSRIRGTEELLENECGLLFSVGDSDQLARHMAWLLEHPAEARTMALRARDRMADYDIQKIIALHEQLYQRAMERVARGK